nr:unknown protein [Corynebacterium glutamicum]
MNNSCLSQSTQWWWRGN